MSIVLQSSGGGSVTVQEPTTASNFTATLPAATGEVMVSGNMPAFSAFLSTSMGSITSGVDTKITYQTALFDTAGCYNNTGSTVTLNGISTPSYSFAPNVAGYYQINAVFRADNSPVRQIVYLYKNGSFFQQGNDIAGGAGVSLVLSFLVYANGTSDTFSIFGLATGAPTVTSTANSISASLVRVA